MHINLLRDYHIRNNHQGKNKQFVNKNKYIIALTLLIPTLITGYHLAQKPRVLLSPLNHADQPEIVRQSLTETKEPLAYYIATSDNYLSRARVLSNSLGDNQTQDDKNKIVSLLNQSLKSANNAISNYPSSPLGFQQRAKVYQIVAYIDPTAGPKAERDITIATQLAKGELKAQDIKPEDLINSQPLQEASLLDNIAIALPEDNKTADNQAEEISNSKRGTATIKTGEQEVIVTSEFVNDDNLIYFTPVGSTQNEVVSLKSKSELNSEFTLHLSAPLPYNLEITWWIIE